MRDPRHAYRVPVAPFSLAVATVALAIAGVAMAAEVVVGEEILGNKEAASLVLQARRHDPMFSRQIDRDRAIALYEKAMAIQPGARANAVLANRVAQLYAHYADRGKGISPNQEMAASWWKRCLKETNSTQFLWAEAHMGLGCAAFLTGRPGEAVEAFKAILSVDAQRMRLPDWKVWPEGNAEHDKSFLEKERAHLRKNLERLKIMAVDMILYVLIRVDGAAAVSTLLTVARDHRGTPVGAHASRLAEEALRSSSASLYRNQNLHWASTDELLGLAERCGKREVSEGPAIATTTQLAPPSGPWGPSAQRPERSDTARAREGVPVSCWALRLALTSAAGALGAAACFFVVWRRMSGRRVSIRLRRKGV